MAYLYLDDSKHQEFSFSLAAFVICEEDPTSGVIQIFKSHGFDPEQFEFKSTLLWKEAGDSLVELRDALKHFIHRNCKISVCVVDEDKRLGPAALMLLSASLKHPQLAGGQHRVFFDQGLFSSEKKAFITATSDDSLQNCDFAFEQNSKSMLGIQLADLVAHTCGTMLKETLSPVPKIVTLNDPNDRAYHGKEVPLEFELWAGIRYSLLGEVKSVHASDPEHPDFATVVMHPFGLFVDESVCTKIASAAMDRFGKIYLGCVH